MSVVVLADIVTLASYLGAGALLGILGRRTIPHDIWWALTILVGLSAIYELSNLMETAAVTGIFDPFEDLLGMMQPIAWGALLYAYEQSAARREGARRENLLSAALHGGRLGAWDWHVESGGVQWFGLSEQIFGFAPGTFPSSIEAVRERVHPEDRQSMWDDVERSLQTDAPYESTYRIVLPGGEARWVRATGLVHRDGGASPVRMVGTVRDVTEEHTAVRERERLADIIETTTDFVGTASPKGEVLYLNPAARRLLGIPDDADLSGWVFRQLHPEWAVRMIEDEGIPAAIRDGAWSTESAVLALDGREIPVSQLIIAHRASGGRAAYLSTVIRDISERKRAEEELQRSEERFREFTSIAADWIWEMGPDLKFRMVSERIEEITGLPASYFIGKSRDELGDFSADPDVLDRHLADLAARRPFRDFRYRSVDADGSVHWYETSGRPQFDDGGEFTGYRGTGRDVTAEVKAQEAVQESEERLRASEARYRALYEDNPSMYLTLDPSGVILSVNRYGAEQLGHDGGDLVGVGARTLYAEEDRGSFDRFLSECLDNPGVPQRWELPKRRADGSVLWVRETARAVSGADGETVVLIVSEDASEARDLSERLAYEASHDGLTALINRREFENRLERVLESTRSTPHTHVLCYLDLDQFKVVNDTCGHIAGDELLRQLGGMLHKQVRQRDTVARLGGDEFALLIERCPMDQGLEIANKLRRAVEDYRFQWEDYSFKVGVSIGLVPIDASSPTAANVLALADSACYVAKDLGRNRVHVYDEDDEAIARRTGEMQWVGRLNAALESNSFRLMRQNITAVQWLGQGEHFELLLRMQDEKGVLISPGTFLPAAERYNVMARLDRWVLDAALDWLAGGSIDLDDLFLCGINLSGHSLTDDDFLAYAVERVRGSSVPADKLCFEITETAAITNFADAHRFITALRELGCVFALDDFGSGLSSFGYLKTLPVDFLKIDGTFVKDIVEDPIDLAMVEAINRVGQVMGKWTIAECVESEEVLELLQQIGVNFAQGFHIHRPEPLGGAPARD